MNSPVMREISVALTRAAWADQRNLSAITDLESHAFEQRPVVKQKSSAHR